MRKLTIDELEKIEIFNNISMISLNELVNLGEFKKYNTGSHIFRDKDEVRSLYVVLSGKVSLYKLNEFGNKRVIFILDKGKMINEVIIQDLPASINCEVFEDAEIIKYDKQEFLRIMEDDFKLTKNVICSLSLKTRRMYRQLKNSTGILKMEKRIAAKIWKLSRDHGIECDQGTIINMNISVTYLADLLGAKRETISRGLKILHNEKLISYKDKKIVVTDKAKLSKFFKAP